MKMKELGYVFDLELVFYDVEEEDKEMYLVVYSEKLVIVFVLMNIEEGEEDNNVIRIMKNFRICGDCYVVVKFIF